MKTVVHFFICILMATAERKIFAENNPVFDNMIQLSGAVKVTYSPSSLRCLLDCYGYEECVAFFYNGNTMKCVMHSTKVTPSSKEQGWKYYSARDERCPNPYLYYRPLDFCYTIRSGLAVNFLDIHTECTNVDGRLAAVDSKEKHDYFKNVLANRPLPQYKRVAVGGNRTDDYVWTLYNGQQLTYFYWANNEPSHINALCLQSINDELYDCPCDEGLDRMYICET